MESSVVIEVSKLQCVQKAVIVYDECMQIVEWAALLVTYVAM